MLPLSNSLKSYYNVKLNEDVKKKELLKENKEKEHSSESFIQDYAIYTASIYSIVVMIINILDYVWYIGYNTTGFIPTIKFAIAWIVFSVLQLADYLLVIILSSKENVQFMSLSFILFSVIFISLVICVVIDIQRGVTEKFNLIHILQYKFSPSAPLRGYLPAINLSRNKSLHQVHEHKQTSAFLAALSVSSDIAVRAVHTVYHLICFILYFLGLFCFTSDMQTFNIFYFEIVTLGTIGYGDITFPDVLNRAMTILFIVSSIIYVPQAITIILNDMEEKFPETAIKVQCLNGVVVIGKFDHSFAAISRQLLPSRVDLAYLITQFSSDSNTIFNRGFRSSNIGQFSWDIANLYQVQRASRIICLSTSAEDDIETILNAEIIVNYTNSTQPLLVALFNNEYEELANTMLLKQNTNNIQIPIIILNQTDIAVNLIVASTLYEGFSTFILNLMSKKECNINGWDKDELKHSVKDIASNIGGNKNFDKIRKRYLASLNHIIYLKQNCDLPSTMIRRIGSDKLCMKNDKFNQIQSLIQQASQDDLLCQTTSSVSIVADNNVDCGLLANVVTNLSKHGVKITLSTDLEISEQIDKDTVKIIPRRMSALEKEEFCKSDMLLCFAFPKEQFQHHNLHEYEKECAEHMCFKRYLILCDHVPEQKDQQYSLASYFRAGNVISCIKAFTLSCIVGAHKQSITALLFLEEVLAGKVNVQVQKVQKMSQKDELTVAKAVGSNILLYYKTCVNFDKYACICTQVDLDKTNLKQGDLIITAQSK